MYEPMQRIQILKNEDDDDRFSISRTLLVALGLTAYLLGRSLQISLDGNAKASHSLHGLLSWDGLAGRARCGAVLRILQADFNGPDSFGRSASTGRELRCRESTQRQGRGLTEEGPTRAGDGAGDFTAVTGASIVSGGTHPKST